MSRRVEKHEIVQTDLAELSEFIRQDHPRAAIRFLESAETTFQILAGMPGIGSPYESENPELAGLRCARVSGFENHLIFYRTIADGIEVIRVLHGARDIKAILEG